MNYDDWKLATPPEYSEAPQPEEPPARPLGYSAKVDALLELANGFTASDFAALCVAAADQAGADIEEQNKIRAIVGPFCDCCARPVAGYESGVVRPVGWQTSTAEPILCEECHGIDKRLAKAQEAEAIRDGRGDYLRDQQIDRELTRGGE